MKTLLVSMFVSVLSCAAFASDRLPQPAPNSLFDRVLENFSKGSTPSLQGFEGAWTGRCYTSEAPDRPYGMLLVGKMIQTSNADNGPQFPPSGPTEYLAMALSNQWGSKERATRYDQLTPEDRDNILYLLTQPEFRRLAVTEQNQSFVSSNKGKAVEYHVRQFSNMMMAKMVTAGKNPDNKANVKVACYFFQQVLSF